MDILNGVIKLLLTVYLSVIFLTKKMAYHSVLRMDEQNGMQMGRYQDGQIANYGTAKMTDDDRITTFEVASLINATRQYVCQLKIPGAVKNGRGRAATYPRAKTLAFLKTKYPNGFPGKLKANSSKYFMMTGFHVEILKFVKPGLWSRFGGYDEMQLKAGKL
jgi:hypothetical protein